MASNPRSLSAARHAFIDLCLLGMVLAARLSLYPFADCSADIWLCTRYVGLLVHARHGRHCAHSPTSPVYLSGTVLAGARCTSSLFCDLCDSVGGGCTVCAESGFHGTHGCVLLL